MSFRKVDISDIKTDPFTKIGKEWMLITGGNMDDYNTMTASWGQLGVLWNKNVITCYIRPNRYTYEYVEKGDTFTVSFYGEEYRKALSFCGSHSGRDCDKAKETGLTPAEFDGNVAFAEADMVFVCRKLYSHQFEQEKVPKEVADWIYTRVPPHTMFIGEIVEVIER